MKCLDLFSGIGGFHLACKQVLRDEFKICGFSEIDSQAISSYKKFFNCDHLSSGDVTNLVSGESNEWGVDSFDILCGGFPCQPFSNVGKRFGLNDHRSWVFYDILRVLKYYKPQFFVLENVEKIKTIEKGKVLSKLIQLLSDLGYKVDLFTLCSSDFSLPQNRKRVFFCGRKLKNGKCIGDLPAPSSQDLEEATYPTTWHLLEKEMHSKHVVPTKTRETVFKRNPKWMGDLEVDKKIARPICSSMGKWHRANQDNYFTDHYIFSSSGERHPSFDYRKHNVRRITPLEGLRLQGFPDEFDRTFNQCNVRPTGAYKLIGNAVPVNLAAAVISNLISKN
jgi:DNA (cytosine-5)-methyltransferase 1